MDLTHLKTGQVYQGLAILQGRRYPRETEFNTMFKDGWKFLASIDGLTGQDYRVFSALMQRMDFGNWIRVSQETMAEELGLKRPAVTRSINRLLKYNVIQRKREEVDKRRWMYRLNPQIGWKGKANQWMRVIGDD